MNLFDFLRLASLNHSIFRDRISDVDKNEFKLKSSQLIEQKCTIVLTENGTEIRNRDGKIVGMAKLVNPYEYKVIVDDKVKYFDSSRDLWV